MMPYLPDVFCGMSPVSQNCPPGWSCNVHVVDAWAICCPDNNAPNQCAVSITIHHVHAIRYIEKTYHVTHRTHKTSKETLSKINAHRMIG